MAKSNLRGCVGWVLIIVGVAVVGFGLLLGIVGSESDNEKSEASKKAWAEFTEWMESEEGQRYDSLNQALMVAVGEDSAAIEEQMKQITPMEQPPYRAQGILTILGWAFGILFIGIGGAAILIGWLIKRKKKNNVRQTW